MSVERKLLLISACLKKPEGLSPSCCCASLRPNSEFFKHAVRPPACLCMCHPIVISWWRCIHNNLLAAIVATWRRVLIAAVLNVCNSSHHWNAPPENLYEFIWIIVECECKKTWNFQFSDKIFWLTQYYLQFSCLSCYCLMWLNALREMCAWKQLQRLPCFRMRLWSVPSPNN